MKIKKGDNVIVLTGAGRGKTGKVIRAFPREEKVVVEGVNAKKKTQRAHQRGGKGQLLSVAFPIHVSNVKLAKANK